MIASGALKVVITGFWHFWVLTIQQQLLPHYVSLFWGMLGSHFGNQIWHMKILIWMLYSQHSLATTWIKESLFDQKLDQILTRNSWSSLSQIIQNLSRPSLFWDFAPSLYWVNFFVILRLDSLESKLTPKWLCQGLVHNRIIGPNFESHWVTFRLLVRRWTHSQNQV